MMFDDYSYKSNQYFEFKFKQKTDEKILPWEMAGFINNYNTLYYKRDLLNSISSCILKKISPKDIFIFDGTLPLNQKYSALNLINESTASAFFYNIGKPYSITPNQETYKINFLYEIFYTINSLLRSRHFKPLNTKILSESFQINKKFDLQKSKNYLVKTAAETTEKFHDKYSKHYSDRSPLTEEEINKKLERVLTKQSKTLSLVIDIEKFSDDELISMMSSTKRDDQKYRILINKFYDVFHRVTRPVVCARVGEGKIRVLSRGLVNKSAHGALELKKASKNSPAEFIFSGLINAAKVGVEIKHSIDLHKIEKQIKENELKKSEIEVEKAQIELDSAKIEKEKIAHEAELSKRELEEYKKTTSISDSDINNHQKLKESATKRNLAIAYNTLDQRTSSLMKDYGMQYVPDSFKPISFKA